MDHKRKHIMTALLFLLLPLMIHAQQPRLIKVSEFSVSQIPTIEERVCMLHTIIEKGYFCYKNPNLPNTIDVYVQDDASDELSDFDFFYDNVLYSQLDEFSTLDKIQRGNLFVEWIQEIDDEVYRTIYEDFTHGTRTDNATCETALPFCTDVGLYNFPAGVNSGSPCGNTTQASCSDPYHCSNNPGQDNCLNTAPNPAFYYLRIDHPGNIRIFMESSPSVDIDFDCWGPFNDVTTACEQLSCRNIVDCSYNAQHTENCTINNAQTGEYYILLITNFSNQPCNISFSKVEGEATTDCSILPPLVSGGGPYCVGQTIQLTAQNQAGATFRWSGPNGFESTQQNPSIPNCTMEMAGVYTCTITVGGESSSAETEYVQVNALPVADFDFTEVCIGESTQFTSTSTTEPLGQDISSYEWDFGDGNTGRGQSISHTYAEAGTYQVSLVAATGSGICMDEITKTVRVFPIPVATATANPTSVMYGGSSTITVAVEPPGNYSYQWSPANMVTDPNSQTTQTVAIEDTQVYTVTITSIEGGCTSTAQVAVAMAGSNMTATVSADHTNLCEGEATSLHALPIAGTGEYQYSWTPTNTLSGPTSQNPVATPPVGTTTYTCTIQDGLTTQQVSIEITVHPKEEKDIYASICEDGSYDFYGQILTTEGVYHHTLQTNLYHCDSIIHLHLSLNPVGSESIATEDLTYSNIVGCDSAYWHPGNGFVSSDQYQPNNNWFKRSSQDGHPYQRVYTNQAGCDSLVSLSLNLEYTPDPIEIRPVDLNDPAPHWVVPATEFQINSYEFHIKEKTHPTCNWDSIRWEFEDPNIDWILEPDETTQPTPRMKCKMFVLNHVDDTIWIRATVYNKCAPNGIPPQRYWFVCSFYGMDEDGTTSPTNFAVVPNPNNGQMQLLFERLEGKAEVKVYNMKGVLIDRFETYNSSGRLTYPYEMKTYADGMYFFIVTTKEGTASKKVVIQR